MNTPSDDKTPAHIPLGYRSADADRRARQNARAGGGGSVAIGCLGSFLCLIPLLMLTCSGVLNAIPYALPAVWIAVPCSLLIIGVAIGVRYRNWGVFTGIITSLFIAAGLFSMAWSICGP